MNHLFRLALDASIRIALVALCVGAILIVTRVRSGAVRHAGWTAVLCAMVLMPVLPNLVPGIGVRVQTPAISWAVETHQEGATERGAGQTMPARKVTEAGPTLTQAIEGSRPAPQPVSPGSSHGSVRAAAALAVYLAGLLLLLTRMVAGWYSARRLARAAQPVPAPLAGVRLYQSANIATPLIVGVLYPRILLPRSWKGWSHATLHAVLAHEMAHLRRRDTLVALGAGLNRCVFWFHPLAWWLQRKLAATSEQACDEAGVRAMGHSRQYAEVLLQMAEAVRRRGGRLSWQGIGMYGAGSLQQRIDRIISGDAARAIPRRHKALVAVGCAAAIFFGAACRQAAQPDATVTANSAARRLDSKQSYRLGVFYAAILMALPEAFEMGQLSPQDYAACAAEIRKRLERSEDRTLLLETSSRLLAWGRIRQKKIPGDFDLFAFGKSLVQRALQLDPQSTWAHQLLTVAADQDLIARLPESVLQGPVESRHQAIQTLPDGERFRELTVLAIEAGDRGIRADRTEHDAIAAKAAWQQAGRYAREALDLAPKAQSHPDYGTAFFNANMVLGLEAIQGGDPKAASSYLLKAADAPVTQALKYPAPNTRPWGNLHTPTTLAAALLKAGQRDAVVAYMESYARILVGGRDRWLEDIALIRQGKLPSWART